MSRILTVGAAQMGPIQRSESRASAVERMIVMMRQAEGHGCDLIVYPEAALTAFFPHWWIDDETEIDGHFETAMPNNETAALFAEAKKLSIGFHLGYCELAHEEGRKRRFNAAILVDKSGTIVGKYRKIHLPGHPDHKPQNAFQNLEKRYFETGNLGWKVWRTMGGNIGMMICNDRRWPESYHVMGLQDVEMIVLGYNTPKHNPPAPDHDRLGNFHNQLVMQAGAYQNATWVVGVAKTGVEAGVDQIGGSCIIAPTGEVVAQAVTEGDELVVARCDLDIGQSYKASTFAFERHREPQAYAMIVERKGARPPR